MGNYGTHAVMTILHISRNGTTFNVQSVEQQGIVNVHRPSCCQATVTWSCFQLSVGNHSHLHYMIRKLADDAYCDVSVTRVLEAGDSLCALVGSVPGALSHTTEEQT